MKRVVVIGSGNVAEGLLQGFATRGCPVEQLFARNAARGEVLASAAGCPWTDDPMQLATADLYLIAVSDAAVGELSQRLTFPAAAVVAHTAGSIPLTELSQHIARRGVFYPLQTFTAGRGVDLSEVPFCVEGSDAQSEALLCEVAALLSNRVYVMDGTQRARLHLAAVFSCNFTNYMYGVGEELLREAELPTDLLRPLIAETTAKALQAERAVAVQTGPAVRGDRNTQTRQLEMLRTHPQLQNMYKLISEQIWETSKKI